MRHSVTVVSTFVLFAISASAQPRSAEVFGLAGISRVAGDEGSLGTGVAGAGAVVLPLTRSLAVDVDVAYTSSSRDVSAGLRLEAKQTLVNPSLIYRRGSERVYAFVGGGVGGEFSELQNRFDSNGVTLNAKGGVVARIRGNLLFRADILTAWRYVMPHVQARAGIGYRF